MACTAPRLFRHRRTHEYWLAACQRFSCTACMRTVANRWRAILTWASQHGHAPQYFLTLTLRDPLPLWREAPADQQEALRQQAQALAARLSRALSRLAEEIRAQYGPFEYLAVVELTTGKRTPGHRPHLHLLVRGPALPPTWLRDRWCFHSKGSFKVDLQRLRSPALAGDYLMGYTTAKRKHAQRAQLRNWPGPRIRYSQRFFPCPVPQIRTLLWPPQEPGVWEFVGRVPFHWQLTWQVALSGAVDQPPSAAPA